MVDLHRPLVRASGRTQELPAGDLLGPLALLAQIATADQNMANNNAVQSMFLASSSADAVAVEASTVYHLQGWVEITRASGSQTLSFLLGGTATFTSLALRAYGFIDSNNTIRQFRYTTAAGGIIMSHATGGTWVSGWAALDGYLEINAAGTILPQLQWSAAPGATPVVKAGSKLLLQKLATNPQGTWS